MAYQAGTTSLLVIRRRYDAPGRSASRVAGPCAPRRVGTAGSCSRQSQLDRSRSSHSASARFSSRNTASKLAARDRGRSAGRRPAAPPRALSSAVTRAPRVRGSPCESAKVFLAAGSTVSQRLGVDTQEGCRSAAPPAAGSAVRSSSQVHEDAVPADAVLQRPQLTEVVPAVEVRELRRLPVRRLASRAGSAATASAKVGSALDSLAAGEPVLGVGTGDRLAQDRDEPRVRERAGHRRSRARSL